MVSFQFVNTLRIAKKIINDNAKQLFVVTYNSMLKSVYHQYNFQRRKSCQHPSHQKQNGKSQLSKTLNIHCICLQKKVCLPNIVFLQRSKLSNFDSISSRIPAFLANSSILSSVIQIGFNIRAT